MPHSRLDSAARAVLDAPGTALDAADRAEMITSLRATGYDNPPQGRRFEDESDAYVASYFVSMKRFDSAGPTDAERARMTHVVRFDAPRLDAARYDADGEIRFDSLPHSHRVEINAEARLNIEHLRDGLSESGYEKELEKARKAVLYRLRSDEIRRAGRR